MVIFIWRNEGSQVICNCSNNFLVNPKLLSCISRCVGIFPFTFLLITFEKKSLYKPRIKPSTYRYRVQHHNPMIHSSQTTLQNYLSLTFSSLFSIFITIGNSIEIQHSSHHAIVFGRRTRGLRHHATL